MNIYNLTYTALEEYFEERGLNKAKAKIVYNAVYRRRVNDFAQIRELSTRVTDMLKADFESLDSPLDTVDKKTADDCVKLAFSLADKARVESVFMRHDYGNALCVSTQVGCNMRCAFCRSGQGKLRDLLPYEMVLQLMSAEKETGEKIARLNLMGIGEPLDNFENVMDFISIVGHPHGLAISPRHITISTCGLVPKIERILREELYRDFNLAISLHAPNDDVRSRIMPVNKSYNVRELIEAARKYSRVKGGKTTLEYVMLDGVNDSVDNALELCALLKGVDCYVNLIPYNETGLGFKRSPRDKVDGFCKVLLENNIRAVVRREFGGEIMAACGQLTIDNVQ